ncbi:hypothetical protein KR767_16870 [Luteibacter anthropi]|uniref:hypothetical protein n=1 Tax=Luteibacter anthropi TaxID=564369 RepID=UPI002032C388|nr:hypothetical protein [Luteibacter anthropi]URX61716.1 hypothetical protein KR767_16870 [Luteibacter anthropi]
MNAITHHLRPPHDAVAAGKWDAPQPVRWMVLYDGTPAADEAVAAGMEHAREGGAALFLVAADLRADPHDRTDYARALSDDLSTFSRFAAKAGLDVDGTYIEHPNVDNLLAVAASHAVTGIIVTTPFPEGLLGEFAQRSELPRLVALTGDGRGGAV